MTIQREATGSRTILVIEDEYFFATDLCAALQAYGFDIVGPASRKAGAVKLIESESFDFVVMDVNLHGIMVFDLADQLLEMEKPFMFVTGYFATEIPERFAGIPFMSKPVPGDRLALEVRQIIDGINRA